MPPGIGYGGGWGSNKGLLPFLGGNSQGGQAQMAPTLAPGATMAPAAAAPPGPEDFFGQKGLSSKAYGGNLVAGGISGIYGFGPQAQQAGFTNLLQILQGQGATDPRLLNQQLASASLGNQAQQNDFEAALARMGLGASGVGRATGAAIGQAGSNQRAQLLAQEAQLQEARKRDDLNLLLNLIINPGLSALTGKLAQSSGPGGPSDLEALLGAGVSLGSAALM